MTLYSAFLSMAPFILLVVTAGAFGPWSADDDKEWSYTFLWDVVLVLTVVTGGTLSILVLGEVVSPSAVTQDFVVVAGFVGTLTRAAGREDAGFFAVSTETWRAGSMRRATPLTSLPDGLREFSWLALVPFAITSSSLPPRSPWCFRC